MPRAAHGCPAQPRAATLSITRHQWYARCEPRLLIGSTVLRPFHKQNRLPRTTRKGARDEISVCAIIIIVVTSSFSFLLLIAKETELVKTLTRRCTAPFYPITDRFF